MNKPLAQKLAPTTLDEVIGQKHLIGKDKILTNLVKNKKIFSMILYGKPGIGKTSIANAIANDLGLKHRFLNATTNTKKDLTVVIEEAKMYDGIILIMDEIHRLHKDIQDVLLPQLESGLITLIGMTTSNPYHSINPAIRSRCQLFELQPLDTQDIIEGLNKATKHPDLRGIKIDDKTIELIATLSGNDLRYAYNLLEIAYYSTDDKTITEEKVRRINNKPVFFSDKNGDGHYDVLSALQKSIRGSDVNASLHYAARLIEAGDLPSLARRLTVIAYEDIGLANPDAQIHTVTALDAAQRIGFPEARILIANVVIDLALSPKSNSAITAIDKAISDLHQNGNLPIPRHLRDGHYAGSKELGNAQGYKYPHDYPEKWVKQQYLPDKLVGKNYFDANQTGKYERALGANKERIDELSK